MLFAVVKYSTADYADSTHPIEEEDFTLPLPSVRFDSNSKQFTVNGTVVATLRPDLIGSSVALDPKLTLSIHRHHGVIYAAIVPRNHDY
jgi:hypothetical protein